MIYGFVAKRLFFKNHVRKLLRFIACVICFASIPGPIVWSFVMAGVLFSFRHQYPWLGVFLVDPVLLTNFILAFVLLLCGVDSSLLAISPSILCLPGLKRSVQRPYGLCG